MSLVVALIASFPAAARAQSAQTPPDPPPGARTDFLFGRPHGSIGVRGGWLFARAGSDLFDFVTRELTLDKTDFNTPGVAVDLAFVVRPQLEVVGTMEFHRTSSVSEYREFVDNFLLPIQQTTLLNTYQFGASVRYALTPRGTDVSRYAWVPRRVVPFVGAGAGAVRYEFAQSGDFVDFVDLSVFTDYFESKGWAPSAHVLGGADIQIYRGFYGTLDARYVWAKGKLSSDFIDFDPIDLAGFRLSAGVNLLF